MGTRLERARFGAAQRIGRDTPASWLESMGMKTRESGMPGEETWAAFFSPAETLRRLGLPSVGDVVDFGCGYGTFTIPAAQMTSGTVHALDIEPEMVAATRAKAEGQRNVRVSLRDFVAEGTGLADGCVQYAMLFNILHAESPDVLLGEAYRVLAAGGKLGIMHWNYDPSTPRGPSMDIRPRPEQCRAWAERVGFRFIEMVDLPPYHWGMVLIRPQSATSAAKLTDS